MPPRRGEGMNDSPPEACPPDHTVSLEQHSPTDPRPQDRPPRNIQDQAGSHTPTHPPIITACASGVGAKETQVAGWVPAALPRSLRGRPSQVKGASGVADAMPLRATLDLRASTAPPGSVAGRPKALPATTRGSAAGTHPTHHDQGPTDHYTDRASSQTFDPDAYQPRQKTDKNNKQQRSATPTH
jgi:hypothetical protein